MPTLAGIEGEISTVLAAFTDAEIDEHQQRAVEEYLTELAHAEADKVEGYLVVESKAKAEVDWLKDQAATYAARAKSLENTLAWRKGYLLRTMQEHGLRKLQGRSGCSITRQDSPAKLMLDMERLPADYKREVVTVTTEADRERIKADIEAGREVPGAELVRGEHVRFNRARGKQG
jgi:hypothetical protein